MKKKIDMSQFESEIAKAEEMFLKLGASRMSEYFGVKNFKNRISSYNVLWIPDNHGYYNIKAKKQFRKVWIVVQYSTEMDKGFEDYSDFEYSDDEEKLSEAVNGIIHGVLPKEEEILNRYIDTEDRPFSPDVTAITEEIFIDDSVSAPLIIYVDPKVKAEIMADSAWRSIKERPEEKAGEDLEAVIKLEEAFLGYWDAENFDKALLVALDIKRMVTESFPEDRYLNLLAELYVLIGRYLKDDYVDAMYIGIAITESAKDFEDASWIITQATRYLANIYFALDYREKAVSTAKEYLNLCSKYYGDDNEETLRAKLKYDLYKGLDSSPRTAIEEADRIYQHFLKKEGDQGDNTVSALGNLSYLLALAGDYNQALMTNAKIYKTYELKYGRDDRLTLLALLDMADAVSYIPDGYNDAAVLAKYAYDRASLKYGDKSVEASTALSSLAGIHKRFGGGGKYYLATEKCYQIVEELYGPDHPNTIREKAAFAEAHRLFSQYKRDGGKDHIESALKLDQEVYEWKKATFGENDRLTVEAEENTIFDLFKLDKKEEALDLQLKLIERCEKNYGLESPICIARYHNLSYMLSELKRYDNALAIDMHLLKLYKGIYSETHPKMLGTVEDIVRDLRDLERYEDAINYSYQELARRIELLGEYNEHTKILMDLFLSVKQQMQTVVHYFRYHVPEFMGFEVLKEDDGYVVYYKESDGHMGENADQIAVSEEKVAELIEILKPTAAWKEKYEGKSSFYGEGYELEVRYGDMKVKSDGKFAYPDDYEEIHNMVLLWLSELAR